MSAPISDEDRYAIEEGEDGWEVVVRPEIVSNSRWDYTKVMVAKAPDGRFWSITWEEGATEIQDSGYEDTGRMVEVWPVERTTTDYVTKKPT